MAVLKGISELEKEYCAEVIIHGWFLDWWLCDPRIEEYSWYSFNSISLYCNSSKRNKNLLNEFSQDYQSALAWLKQEKKYIWLVHYVWESDLILLQRLRWQLKKYGSCMPLTFFSLMECCHWKIHSKSWSAWTSVDCANSHSLPRRKLGFISNSFWWICCETLGSLQLTMLAAN